MCDSNQGERTLILGEKMIQNCKVYQNYLRISNWCKQSVIQEVSSAQLLSTCTYILFIQKKKNCIYVLHTQSNTKFWTMITELFTNRHRESLHIFNSSSFLSLAPNFFSLYIFVLFLLSNIYIYWFEIDSKKKSLTGKLWRHVEASYRKQRNWHVLSILLSKEKYTWILGKEDYFKTYVSLGLATT